MFTSIPRVLRTLGTVLWAVAVAGPVAATTVSPVQPGATPLSVGPFSPVMASGSDSRPVRAKRDVLPILSAVSLATLTEQAVAGDAGAIAVDPFRLLDGQVGGKQVRSLRGAARARDDRSHARARSAVPGMLAEHLFPKANSPLGHGENRSVTLRLTKPLLPGDFMDLHVALVQGDRRPLRLIGDAASDALLIVGDVEDTHPIALVFPVSDDAGL